MTSNPLLRRLLLPALVAAAAVSYSAGAGAQDPADESPSLERVEVSGARSSVMPYARWVQAAQPIHALSQGSLRQGVRVFSRDRSRPLRMSITDEQQSVALAPLVGELFVVPHDLPVDAAQAELGVNRAEGEWGVGNFALVPQLNAGSTDMAQVRAVLRGYQTVYRQRFPMRWRLLSRSEASLDICTTQVGQSLELLDEAGQPVARLALERTLDEHRDTTGLKLHCASLRADAELGDRLRLALPPQAVALLGFRLL